MLKSKLSKLFSVTLIGASAVVATQVATPAFAEPAVVKMVAPEYPRGAERRKIEGTVLVEFTIQPDGSTLNPTVLEADPAGVFDAAAIKAIQKWKYESSGAETPGVQKKLRFKLS